MKSKIYLFAVAFAAAHLMSATTRSFADDKTAQEVRLTAVLKSDASLEQKSAACRELARIASKESVSTLASLLGDEKLSHMARYTLETIPDPSADDALRDALGKVKGRPLLGVIGSIGVRRDEKAIETLAKLITSPDIAVASAAARALGNLGTIEAAESLTNGLEKASSSVKSAICEGLLRCSERLAVEKHDADAKKIYVSLFNMPGVPKPIRWASLRGIALSKDTSDTAVLVAAIKGHDDGLIAAAARAAMEMPGHESTAALCQCLPDVTSEVKVLIIDTLGYRGDSSAGPKLLEMLKDKDPAVQLAAVNNLTHLGYAPALPALAELALGEKSELATTARTCLANFPGHDADATLQTMLSNSNAKVRALAAEMIGQRNSSGATTNLLTAATDADLSVRLAALKALREHAAAVDLPALLAILVGAKSQGEIQAAQSAVNSLCVRQGAIAAHNVVVVKAEYGDLSAGIEADVTDKVAAMVKGGLLAIDATNSNFGDPADGRVKKLRIAYRAGDAITIKTVDENETLTLTSNSLPPEIVDSLCQSAQAARGPAKLALLHVLRTAGGAKALQTANAILVDGDSQTKDTALRVICDWPTPDAVPLLCELFKEPPTATIKVLALRGIVRLIPLASTPDADKLVTLKQSLKSASDDEEKRLVLSALATIATPDALTLAASYLDDPALKEEASLAAVAIAEHLPQDGRKNAAAVMVKVAKATSRPELAAKAKKLAK